MRGAEIEDAVHGVESETVDVIFAHPVAGVVDDESAHVIAVRVVVIERRPPRRLVLLGEVRAVAGEIIPLGPNVVVHDVENDGEPLGVRRVDEMLQPVWSTIVVLHRIEIDAVVSPVTRSGKLRDGHDLDRGHAKLASQTAQVGDDGRERAFIGEGADVQLVDDEVAHRDPAPVGVVPAKRIRVDDARRSVHAVWLPATHRIRQRLIAVIEYESVLAPNRYAAYERRELSLVVPRELPVPDDVAARKAHSDTLSLR